jgi:hypothetical protein
VFRNVRGIVLLLPIFIAGCGLLRSGNDEARNRASPSSDLEAPPDISGSSPAPADTDTSDDKALEDEERQKSNNAEDSPAGEEPTPMPAPEP